MVSWILSKLFPVRSNQGPVGFGSINYYHRAVERKRYWHERWRELIDYK